MGSVSLPTRLLWLLCLFAVCSLYWQSKVLEMSLSQQQQQQQQCKHSTQRKRRRAQLTLNTTLSQIRGSGSHHRHHPDNSDDDVCDLTAVIFDPRLPIATETSPAWGALESVLAHVTGNVCLVLQTSACILAQQQQPIHNITTTDLWQAIRSRIPSHTPLLRSALDAGSGSWTPTPGGYGHVRLSVVDHERYSLLSCFNFWSPSNAWMNVHYWEHEFTSHDSDLVLILQDDTVLCQTLDPGKFHAKGFAYLGGPWPNKRDGTGLQVCTRMELLWRRWNSLGNIWSTVLAGWFQQGPTCHFAPDNDNRQGESTPPYYGPAGNGGLSLRSRTWMARAIRTCPHARYSGLSPDAIASSPCVVGAPSLFLDGLDTILQSVFGHRLLIYEETGRSAPEDVYFTTVLRGMGAPVPSAFEAALFATELLFPDQVALDWYGPQDPLVQQTMAQELMVPGPSMLDWFEDRLEQGRMRGVKPCNDEKQPVTTQHLLPIGMHKVWRYHDPEFLLSLVRENVCPHLRFVYPLQEVPASFQSTAKELRLVNR